MAKKTNKLVNLNEPPKAVISKKDVEDFLNIDVKSYANYVVKTRALPNIMDGMKVGGRKILYGAMIGKLKKKDTQRVKMSNLIGETMALEFNHGPVSLQNTIEQLGSKHLFQAHPLMVYGQKGSLRIPDAKTADRYLKVGVTPFIDIWKKDSELHKLAIADGKEVEPETMFPIIPTVLLWKTNSPGFGFSFRSFSYSLGNLIDLTLQSVSEGTCNGLNTIPLIPVVDGIKQENFIYNENKDSWYCVGDYKIEGDKITITDLPFNMSYKRFEDHLLTLKEKYIIMDYVNLSTNGNINFQILMNKMRLDALYKTSFKFYTMFKLFCKIPKNTLNLIDIDGESILSFDSAYDLVDAFVKRRLLIYTKRKQYYIKKYNEEKVYLEDINKFIKAIVEDRLIINKRKIADIKIDLDAMGISYEGLKLTISKLTEDEIEKIDNEIADLRSKIEYYQNTTEKELYILDLVDLKYQFSNVKKI